MTPVALRQSLGRWRGYVWSQCQSGFADGILQTCTKPHKPDTKVDGFPSSSLQTKRRPRPSPLAIVRERLFLNSGSGGPLAIRDMRRFVNGGRRSRNTNSPARTFVPGLINGRSGFFREPGNYFGGCSSLVSQPFAASDFSGSGRSQSMHCMMRLPLPPGGSARIMVAPQVGQVSRRPLPM